MLGQEETHAICTTNLQSTAPAAVRVLLLLVTITAVTRTLDTATKIARWKILPSSVGGANSTHKDSPVTLCTSRVPRFGKSRG